MFHGHSSIGMWAIAASNRQVTLTEDVVLLVKRHRLSFDDINDILREVLTQLETYTDEGATCHG